MHKRSQITSCLTGFIIFTNPSARARYDTRSVFKRSLTGLNSEFSFSKTSCLTKPEEHSLSYYLPIGGGIQCYVKCNQSRPGFELVSRCPFSATITITPRALFHYLTHSWEDKGVHTFPKGICPKVNVIARLEYELAYYDSAVHRFNHYTTRTPFNGFNVFYGHGNSIYNVIPLLDRKFTF